MQLALITMSIDAQPCLECDKIKMTLKYSFLFGTNLKVGPQSSGESALTGSVTLLVGM